MDVSRTHLRRAYRHTPVLKTGAVTGRQPPPRAVILHAAGVKVKAERVREGSADPRLLASRLYASYGIIGAVGAIIPRSPSTVSMILLRGERISPVDLKLLITATDPSDNTLANLENRDVALWLRDWPTDPESRAALVAFLGLPWRLVLLEGQDKALIAALEAAANIEEPLARKRGLIQIVDSEPSRIQLPPRCLPVYLLSGRQGGGQPPSFEDRLRRLTMLEVLRQSSPRELLIVSRNSPAVPADLSELWTAGFRTELTFVTDLPAEEAKLDDWVHATSDLAAATLVQLSPKQLIEKILARYLETYPTDRLVIRMRDARGQTHRVDVTNVDEIERPILDSYTLLQERDLFTLVANDLEQDEFISFFKDPSSSWRPYAAALPWLRNTGSSSRLRALLRRMEDLGSDESCIAYIASEPGAGGTTLARMLAWLCARDGYPVLVAKPYPFVPEGLQVANYLTNVLKRFSETVGDPQAGRIEALAASPSGKDGASEHRFETPWVVVFDTLHWQHRDTELMQFRNELARSGRPVCLLVVTGPALGLSYYNGAVFKKIAELNHAIEQEDARALGEHLNGFLRYYGRARTEAQWDSFYEEHTMRLLDGTASFWVTLSFWIQGQYDLSESIQEWIYRAFTAQADERVVQEAILQIAAMSSERLPLPQSLLSRALGRWPVWQLLEDRLSDLSQIGLTRITAQGEQHWALIHDILGRLLINALFYDYPTRDALGLAEAENPDHLRFLVLQGISVNSRLGESAYRSIGEEFATEIFKVDPDHGKSSFAVMWREALNALDKMPQPLRDTSRVFRHHSAISRRRIAKLDSALYGLEDGDKIALLQRAISDINYALTEIPYTAGSEPDLNLLNSLAKAYFDLAEVEVANGASSARISQLKNLAIAATQRAYRESPNNSFVVETYVQSLLVTAKDSPDEALTNCVAALGVIYSALHAGAEDSRKPQLGKLAEQALEILFKQAPSDMAQGEPKTATDLLVKAWIILAENRPARQEWSLDQVPRAKQERALEILANRLGQGNIEILHLRYDLTCNCRPYDYRQQIELLEPLQATQYWIAPQLQLEYAILLFQVGRPVEGDRAFRSLRRLWQTSEQFVQVPLRLRWLRSMDTKEPRTVRAINGSEYGTRAVALVREFSNTKVRFRPEEHGFRHDPPARLAFTSYVSFGHNGPFLRPLSDPPPAAE